MPYLLGADDLCAADPIIPRCCCCGATPDRGTLSPVHLRPTPRFPFLWLYRGRPPRSWWRSCLAAVSLDPPDPEAGRQYVCPACLPLARAVPAPPRVSEAAHGRTDESVERPILALRPVFNREAMVTGVTGKGHRGIVLTRGVVTVRCCACDQEVACVADLAGGTPWDDPPYEYTPAGLSACPAPRSVAR